MLKKKLIRTLDKQLFTKPSKISHFLQKSHFFQVQLEFFFFFRPTAASLYISRDMWGMYFFIVASCEPLRKIKFKTKQQIIFPYNILSSASHVVWNQTYIFFLAHRSKQIYWSCKGVNGIKCLSSESIQCA